ncbi:MAG TPA: zinc dependent phospholipase C family protein [Terracidiphilus sp.]|nr:zinc dependent phospholipase C family protein [Terracidiphilus sp.]
MKTPCYRLPIAALTLILFLLLICAPKRAAAYSLLSHEQLVDLTWDDAIVPLLKSKYPNLTPAELDRARSFAYGGCVIQDMGYYPFGDSFFSDLTHYVRTGDFVMALFRNAHNANELAFAAGALSHYIGDSIGHSEATNRAVALQFPKLAARYGPSVNYAEGKHQHVQVEFAFDVDQIAQHHLAPLEYLRHIGLRVPIHQLALAFYQTYGITDDFSAGTRRKFNAGEYQFATRKFIPRLAYALALMKRNHEVAEPDTPDAKQIEAEVAKAATLYDWAAYRRKAGFETRLIAGVLTVLPKVGPLAMVAIKGPTPQAETDYMHSMVASTTALRHRVVLFTPVDKRDLRSASAASKTDALGPPDPQHILPNRDLDTGKVVKPGGYRLTDETYAKLLHRLTRNPTQPIPPGIKSDIQAYYANPDAPIVTKRKALAWKRVQADLQTLATMPTSAAPTPYPIYGETNPSATNSSSAEPQPPSAKNPPEKANPPPEKKN